MVFLFFNGVGFMQEDKKGLEDEGCNSVGCMDRRELRREGVLRLMGVWSRTCSLTSHLFDSRESPT